MTTYSSFMALPDDVLQRVLVGVLLDDHPATAAACRAFRDVIRGPRFHRLRREYGFAERRILLVAHMVPEGIVIVARTVARRNPNWGSAGLPHVDACSGNVVKHRVGGGPATEGAPGCSPSYVLLVLAALPRFFMFSGGGAPLRLIACSSACSFHECSRCCMSRLLGS